MSHRTAILLPLLTLASPIAAQEIVGPTHFTATEGNSTSSIPFGTQTTYRYLQVHDDVPGSAQMIKGMAVRRDSLTAGAYQPYSITLNAWVSTAATPSTTPSATFATNHGPNKVQVLAFKLLNFPATTQAPPLPGAFVYDIPFSTPFSHPGTGGLAWEVQILGMSGVQDIQHDAVSSLNPNPALTQINYGRGCKGTGRTTPMTIQASSAMSWANGTGNLTVSGFTAPANAPAMFVFGINSKSFLGIPLPFRIPGSDTNPSGPCDILTDMILTIPAFSSATGAVSPLALPVPATTEYAGATVFTQIWAVDPPAALGLATSDAAASHWVAPYTAVKVGRVSSSNNASLTGTPAATNGLVVRFQL